MPDNDLPFPIASYSFGGSPPSTSRRIRPLRMTRRYTLTVAGMFATVSAVAIIFGPTRTQTSDASSAALPPASLGERGPKDAVTPPMSDQTTVTLGSFQTDGILLPQSKPGRAPEPIGGAVRSPASHPTLAQRRALMVAARAVETTGPLLAMDSRAAADGVGASSLPPSSIECGSSCSHDRIGETGVNAVEVGMPRAVIAEDSEASRLVAEAPIEPVLSPSAGPIETSAVKPLADVSERGTLLADTQRPTTVAPQAEAVAVETSAVSTEKRSEEPGPLDGAFAGSPRGSIEQRTLSSSESAQPSAVAVEAPKAAPTEIALHLDRVRKRYGGEVKPAPLIKQPSRAVADPTHAQVVVSPILAPHGTESTFSLVIHDNELVGIELGELISLFEARLDRPLFVWMRSSAAASKFVTAETLAAAGIEAKYDSASKQLVLTLAEE